MGGGGGGGVSYSKIIVVNFYHGLHCTGEIKKMAKKKNPRQDKQGIWKVSQSTGKTQGILFAQVVNYLITKMRAGTLFYTSPHL